MHFFTYESSVDVPVASEESRLDCLTNLIWLGLPCPKADGWDFGALMDVSTFSDDLFKQDVQTVFSVKVFFVHCVSLAMVAGKVSVFF
ncbi:hypothetical protein Tdes44962_MAKER06570 [Teratosphaeria destructans]|uniref:Uncharacterized protein n=1 Tax=Teratosphaeria destructans TaxID=418781 RepID=A0A9W7T1G2_9PEZI|nr:hypothetical protein Tdes44962_MAKER06570 [Teratosphaeria destructans]